MQLFNVFWLTKITQRKFNAMDANNSSVLVTVDAQVKWLAYNRSRWQTKRNRSSCSSCSWHASSPLLHFQQYFEQLNLASYRAVALVVAIFRATKNCSVCWRFCCKPYATIHFCGAACSCCSIDRVGVYRGAMHACYILS